MSARSPRRVGVALVVVVATAGCTGTTNSKEIPPTAPGTTAAVTGPSSSTTSAPTGQSGVSTSTAPATSTVPPSTVPPSTVAPKDLKLGLVEVASIDSPTAFAVRAGDPTLFVTSQAGIVHAIRTGAAPVTVLDIVADTTSGGEQGLLGLAFSADGGTAYVNHTVAGGSGQVEAYRVGADGMFDPASRRVIITIPHPDETNHNGGNLVLGPDGMLYIGTGDGGGSGDPYRNAQDLTSLLGKILRIDPSTTSGDGYDIPSDNPFYAMNSKRNEIWAYGLRNPWRFSFDRVTGDLWIGDVGQNTIEEVDVLRSADGAGRGANLGWSAYEGSKRFNKDQDAPGAVKPLYQYPHNNESASVTGGFVYRGAAVPGMYGAYVFGDAVSGTLWALRTNSSGKPVVAEVGSVNSVAAFGEDQNGELYALSFGLGKVYRIVGAA